MANPVNQSPTKFPDPSSRDYADDWDENVLRPLRQIRDHLHWLAVVRRKRTAAWFEGMVLALLNMAYDYRGRLTRGEE